MVGGSFGLYLDFQSTQHNCLYPYPKIKGLKAIILGTWVV